jgi:hypothetical protein
MQILSQVLTVLSFIMIGVMLVTFRRVRSVSIKAPLISIGISIVTVLVYLTLIGSTLPLFVLWLIGVLGLLLGVVQGKKTKVWNEKGKRKAQNTVWFLVIWAIGYALNQLLTVTGQALSLNLGIGAMSLGTGVTVGSQGIIFFKLLMASSGPGPNVPAQAGTAPKKGSLSAPAQVIRQPLRGTENGAAIGQCRGCGQINPAGSKFCTGCGMKL